MGRGIRGDLCGRTEKWRRERMRKWMNGRTDHRQRDESAGEGLDKYENESMDEWMTGRWRREK